MEVSSALTGRRGIALPFSDHCVVLSDQENPSDLLLGAVRNLAVQRRWRYFELRGAPKGALTGVSPSRNFLGHELDLTTGAARLFSRCSSASRRAVRKARESGVTVEITDTFEAVKEFFKLHTLTRRRHGLPPQPFSFFHAIFEELIAKGSGFVSLASVGSKVIAGALFLLAGDKAVYKFGASDQKHQGLRASNLAMWTAIEHLVGETVTALDFGRTALSADGLRRYKLGWGAEEKIISYFKFDLQADTWVSDPEERWGFHHQVFSRLPLSANRFFGRLLYRHLD